MCCGCCRAIGRLTASEPRGGWWWWWWPTAVSLTRCRWTGVIVLGERGHGNPSILGITCFLPVQHNLEILFLRHIQHVFWLWTLTYTFIVRWQKTKKYYTGCTPGYQVLLYFEETIIKNVIHTHTYGAFERMAGASSFICFACRVPERKEHPSG